MTITQLWEAYKRYVDDVNAYEAAFPFDLMTAMDRPSPPVQSPAAKAGEMIAERKGLERALAVALTDALSRDVPPDKRAVYMDLILAAVDS